MPSGNGFGRLSTSSEERAAAPPTEEPLDLSENVVLPSSLHVEMAHGTCTAHVRHIYGTCTAISGVFTGQLVTYRVAAFPTSQVPCSFDAEMPSG